MIFNCTSKFFRLLLACVSNIKPQTNDKNAPNIIITLTIKVGNRGTKPVLKYSRRIGKNSMSEAKTSTIDRVPKNFNGL